MCTNLTVLSAPGSGYRITARTMDFGTEFDTRVCLIPRNQSFPEDRYYKLVNPLTWVNKKYGFIGMAMGAEDLPHQTVYYSDGMNEAGLSIACLWLPGTVYPAPNEDPNSGPKNLLCLDFAGWVLGNFGTVMQLEQELSKGSVNIVDVDILGRKVRLPQHWMITDALGKHLVVEVIDGVITTYPNKTYPNVPPVMTNAPTFDWQVVNQTNYAHLSLTNGTQQFWGQEINGSGMFGMPGDATPPSRFVRANTLRQSTFAPKNTQQAVELALQVLQNMVVPYGTALTDGGTKDADHTQWSVVRDHQNHVLYFFTAFNNNLFSINLREIEFGSAKKTSIAAVRREWVTDLTQDLTSGTPSAMAPAEEIAAEEAPA
jgi:penicillin V acylase-like amidase (Ntn superfamily)